MPHFANFLVVLHVVADMVWIGAILGVAALLVAPSAGPERAQERGQLALHLYKRVATPAFVSAFVFGMIRLSLDLNFYLVQTHFMHAKLTFATIVIALHHVIGGRAKRLAQSSTAPTGAVVPLGWALLGCAALTIYFALFKPF